jgi:hypothetical protein
MEENDLPESVTEKPSYAPPKAAFVPLKVEERLLACTKYPLLETPGCMTTLAS